MTQVQCVVVTPETTVVDQPAEFVAAPLYDGEKGVAPGHSPMIGRLGYGELRLRSGAHTTRYFIDAGFVQIANNVVTLLTNRAIPAAAIDLEAARKQLDEATARQATTDEAQAIRQRDIAQARAMLRVGQRT